MAANWCLPQKYASAFIDAIKSDKIDFDKLIDMSSDDRRAFFEGIVGKDNALEVNTTFESKLILKDQKAGLARWVEKTAGITPSVRRDLASKIERMDKILTPADQDHFLSDLAAKKLGAAVTAEESAKIVDLAKKATDARDAQTTSRAGVSDEYLKASDDLKHYIASLRPTTALREIAKNVGATGRNFLLMNPAIPIKATSGMTQNYITDFITRRIGARALTGMVSDRASAANAEAWKTFRETGHNVAVMENLNDEGKLGEKANFNVPEAMLSKNPVVRGAEAATRFLNKASTKISIDLEHNITLTKFYQKTFYDMLNITASQLAKAEGGEAPAMKARAGEIFDDAARIEPLTDTGKMVRKIGQMQAARVTSLNPNIISNLALGMKNAMNNGATISGAKIPGVPGLGDVLIPMAKIPAALIYNGIMNAVGHLPVGMVDIVQASRKMASADQAEKLEGLTQLSGGIQKLARVFGTLTVAAYITDSLDKTDFRTDRYGAHYVKIMGTWINTEYIPVIGNALAGMMNVKENWTPGQSTAEEAWHYIAGVGRSLQTVPGLDELSKLVVSATDTDFSKGAGKYLSDLVKERGVPSIVRNALQDRPWDRIFFGAHGVESNEQVQQDTVTDKQRAEATRLGSTKLGMDVWGQPTGMFGADTSDPLDQEIKRLGYSVGFPEPRIRGVKINDDEYRAYIQVAGHDARLDLGRLVSSPFWGRIPDGEKTIIMQKHLEAARERAKSAVLVNHTGIFRRAYEAHMAKLRSGPLAQEPEIVGDDTR